METQIAEIAPNIFRLSTYVQDADFMFNQFLVVDDEPVLFHTGLRAMFPLIEITGPALAAEDVFKATCLTPLTGPTIRSLADLKPQTLGLMHGPSYAGDCSQALCDPASAYDDRLGTEGSRLHGPVSQVT